MAEKQQSGHAALRGLAEEASVPSTELIRPCQPEDAVLLRFNAPAECSDELYMYFGEAAADGTCAGAQMNLAGFWAGYPGYELLFQDGGYPEVFIEGTDTGRACGNAELDLTTAGVTSETAAGKAYCSYSVYKTFADEEHTSVTAFDTHLTDLQSATLFDNLEPSCAVPVVREAPKGAATSGGSRGDGSSGGSGGSGGGASSAEMAFGLAGVTALVAGVVGAIVAVKRRRRRTESEHRYEAPIEDDDFFDNPTGEVGGGEPSPSTWGGDGRPDWEDGSDKKDFRASVSSQKARILQGAGGFEEATI